MDTTVTYTQRECKGLADIQPLPSIADHRTASTARQSRSRRWAHRSSWWSSWDSCETRCDTCNAHCVHSVHCVHWLTSSWRVLRWGWRRPRCAWLCCGSNRFAWADARSYTWMAVPMSWVECCETWPTTPATSAMGWSLWSTDYVVRPFAGRPWISCGAGRPRPSAYWCWRAAAPEERA